MEQKTRARGFTLIEIALAMMVIGIITVIVSPNFKTFAGLNEKTKQQAQRVENLRISEHLLHWAASIDPQGALPAPHVSGNNHFVLCDVLDSSPNGFCNYLKASSGSLVGKLDDGTPGGNLRVYQRVPGQTQQLPLFIHTGPTVTLSFDIGLVYSTRCSRKNPGCAEQGPNDPPGDSPLLDSANYDSWQMAGSDYAAVPFSTLPLQRERLTLLARQIQTLKSQFIAVTPQAYSQVTLVCSQPEPGGSTGPGNGNGNGNGQGNGQGNGNGNGQATNPTTPGSCTETIQTPQNPYPAPSGVGAPNLSGQAASLNQGCFDGWYNLAAADVNVLAQLGLSASEFAKTPWGGTIEYCRDYDVASASAPGEFPHYGALRFHREVSTGVSPSLNNLVENVVISF